MKASSEHSGARASRKRKKRKTKAEREREDEVLALEQQRLLELARQKVAGKK